MTKKPSSVLSCLCKLGHILLSEQHSKEMTMSEATPNQLGRTEEVKKQLVRAAAGIVVGSGKVVGIRRVMEVVGFSELV